MPYRIVPNTELEQGAVGETPLPSFEEVNTFPEQGKHRIHTLSIGLLYNIYFML
jgi:hypothetical protein